jgi:hypothetical protein
MMMTTKDFPLVYSIISDFLLLLLLPLVLLLLRPIHLPSGTVKPSINKKQRCVFA